ncbi:aromatic-ring-hydroxylating dioxygenase subunit beta [Endozoicomonas numazuensis]|uniref:aromatic-ring-hydroxylating dioxygenase subunit beta n=1 Tax=Endozoicomonas numazuensis TaxID=1137799 RepID=UPI0006906A51|nr:aromatic-ring-hydroxylating dioxygenase subunit beta [Endozoicomonas numazuensis]
MTEIGPDSITLKDKTVVKYDQLAGVDGAHSKMRKALTSESVEQGEAVNLNAFGREDNNDEFILSIRVMRAFKPNSWTDNPPPRTRRFVSNVEVLASDQENCFETYSDLMVSYSRHQKDNHPLSAQRKDLLRLEGGEFKIVQREVILDWNVITGPSLSLFL